MVVETVCHLMDILQQSQLACPQAVSHILQVAIQLSVFQRCRPRGISGVPEELLELLIMLYFLQLRDQIVDVHVRCPDLLVQATMETLRVVRCSGAQVAEDEETSEV